MLDTVPLITDPARPTALPTAQSNSALGAVRFDQVDFGYADDLPVLKNFNLELAAGKSIALVGGTGRASRQWRVY